MSRVASAHLPSESALVREKPGLATHQRAILWLASRTGAIEVDGSHWWRRYATALVAVIIATIARQLLDPWLGSRAAYGMYLLAVLFVAWRAGFGPALLTLGCGVLLGRFLFEEPRGSLAITGEANRASLIMSLAIGVVATYFCESLRIAALVNRRLYEAALESDSRKDEFLATVAHELRNPLMPIRTVIHLLENDQHPREQNPELYQMLSRHTEHLIRLVNDLLDVSRITQRKIALRREAIELHAVVNGAVEVVRPLIEEKRQSLSVDVPTGVLLRADGVRLTQVFTNLLHNAAKYTGNEGRIWVSAEVHGNEVIFRVRDTGIGIEKEKCERVFDLFQQVHQGIENSQGGLGIGLTLVRELVQLHDGTVQAQSPGLGLGSEFTVRLPVVEQNPAPVVQGATHQAPAATGSDSLKIMVVDDSPGVTRSLEMVLTDWRHVVRTCADGFAALETARAFKPDYVLTDLSMPRMSGYKLAEELRRMPGMEKMVLIAVSGFGQEADVQRTQAAGFDRHLTKPVDLVELRQLLRGSGE